MSIPNREAAERMRRLSDEDRDALIIEAGDVVVDMRERFEDRRKQVELARAYRRPTRPTGPA